MLPDETPNVEQQVWTMLYEELREIAWLACVVGALSIAGVGLAVALAAA